MTNVDESPIQRPPTAEELKDKAEEQLMLLSSQAQSITQFTTGLDQLIQRYNAQKSYFGYAADWYGEQEWWLKLLLSVVLAVVGPLLQIPLIISCLLSLALSFLLLNHHTVSHDKDQIIARDLEDQRTSLAGSVQYLNVTQEGLGQITLLLCSMHIDIAAAHGKTQQQLEVFKNKAYHYEIVIQEQTTTIQTLNETCTQLHKKLEQASQQLDSNKAILTAQATSLQHTDEALASTHQKLSNHSDGLETVHDAFKASVQTLSQITEKLSPKRKSSPEKPINTSTTNQLLSAAEERIARSKDLVQKSPPRSPNRFGLPRGAPNK